jgi:hypothetical protein
METVDSYMIKVREALADTELVRQVERAARDLEEEGYAVIPNVLDRDLCDKYHGQFWQMLQEASESRLWRPLVAGDLDDFRVTNNWPQNMHGILELGAFAHLPLVHEIRENPRVQLPFALLYGVGKNLTSSVDRLNCQNPAEWLPFAKLKTVNNPADIGTVGDASWLHIDQDAKKLGRYCIQGLVNLEDADQDGDASLELVPRSHVLHENLQQLTGDPKLPKGDWYRFPDEVKEKIQSETGLLRTFKSVKAPKGALVLWDSRTWHQGGRIRAHVTRPREFPRPRFVVYTCFQPNLIPGAPSLQGKELTKRERIFRDHCSASHWPLSSKVFGKPRQRNKIPPPFLNFAPFLLSREELAQHYPVREHFYGLKYDDRIDLLDGQEREPLLDFAPDSGVNKKHPRALELADKNKRAKKRAKVE